MYTSRNNTSWEIVEPLYNGEELIIGIDSSKTNSAITVKDINGNTLDIIEFNGTHDGTSEQDVLVLCMKQREAMSEIFKGAIPRIVGIENIITKTDKRKETGMSIHMSRFKITAVFMSFISFFQDTFNITPELVNNWSWKATTLPEEFRSKKYVKGSLAYFKAIDSKYQYYSDDATDSLCIAEFLCIVHNIQRGYLIKENELPRHECNYFFVSSEIKLNETYKHFIFNDRLTVQQNINVVSNHIQQKEFGVFSVKTNKLPISEIYGRCKGSFKKKEDVLQAIVFYK